MSVIEQLPVPGERLIRHCGDCIEIRLNVIYPVAGEAFVRTNLPAGQWCDLPMTQRGEGDYGVTLPLPSVGVFEAKCTFLPSDGSEQLWAEGDNLHIKVEPALTAANNTIYNAFVRQFGRNRSGGAFGEDVTNAERYLDEHEYTAVPPSGRFRDVLRELPHVMDTLGFRIVQLLPIQPPPVTYARMGRYGSPFAPVDYFSVDTSMAEFDRRTTPLEQFCELVDGIHAHHGLVMLDLPIDHTGWASTMQVHHPEWFCRDEDGCFANPGAWGVVWADLCKLDFSHQELWSYLAAVFLHWCRLGVDGFRCDAGYMIPKAVWQFIIQRVREQFPDTLFFLEGLGGSQQVTQELLAEGGMNWAYSELFQEYGVDSIKGYLAKCFDCSSHFGLAVNFAETHDNDRLAAHSPQWALMRTALAALTSPSGAFGIANGVEWLATEKIDVHGASSLNWGAAENIISHLQRLNAILKWHPAFWASAHCRVIGQGDAVGVLRTAPVADSAVLVVFNVEDNRDAVFEFDTTAYEHSDGILDAFGRSVDLLSGAIVQAEQGGGTVCGLHLKAGETLCLGCRRLDEWRVNAQDANDRQRMRQVVQQIIVASRGYGDCSDVDMDTRVAVLQRDAVACLKGLLAPDGGYVPLVTYRCDVDWRRMVMVPPNHYLVLTDKRHFTVSLYCDGRCVQHAESFGIEGARQQAVLCPLQAPDAWRRTTEIRLVLYEGDKGRHVSGTLVWLPKASEVSVPLEIGCDGTGTFLGLPSMTGLCTNLHGSYSLVRARWGEVHSMYDAMLAAGLSDSCPVDRTLALTRMRVWIVYRDYSVELSAECQKAFRVSYDNSMVWEFEVPTGLGQKVAVTAALRLDHEANQGSVTFTRSSDGPKVTLIMRPEIDWRSHHAATKAFMGAEQAYPRAVAAREDGFVFAPYGNHGLLMTASAGRFSADGEWRYQVFLAEEKQRGLPSETDMFSPGYFRCEFTDSAEFMFAAGQTEALCTQSFTAALPAVKALPFGECLRRSLSMYVVKRDDNRTVMAGYPWFLDWGRDTLICLRGLVAAGHLQESRGIIRAFASFEANGTIPNMIRGNDASDRATSDAPLWLFAAVEAWLKAQPNETERRGLLVMDCHGRPLQSVLESLARHYHARCANGVHVDVESGLIYSLPHFTWMDTNYPAGTPREGYPVEIQALWLSALSFMTRLTGKACYAEWLKQARESFLQQFVRADGLGLYDCLRGQNDCPADQCQKDDAVRPNQLLAITLCDGLLPPEVARNVLRACAALLIPGGIRSLDDAPVALSLPIVRDGVLLNEPLRPYWGDYGGDEDTRRKCAYHNGTAWGWLLPMYCEALVRVYGDSAREAARAWLQSGALILSRNCLGHISEIFDGDAPHSGRGCPAQAWSMTEAYRVWTLLA